MAGWLHSGSSSLLLSLLLIAFALLAGSAPLLASIGLVAMLAWLLVFDGLTQLVCVVQSRRRGLGWELLTVAIYLVAGLWLLVHPLLAPAALALVLTMFFFTEGAADIGYSLWLRRNGGSSSAWPAIDGVITCVLAALVWIRWPSSSVWALTTLLGVKMLMVGVHHLLVILAARRTSKASSIAIVLDRAA